MGILGSGFTDERLTIQSIYFLKALFNCLVNFREGGFKVGYCWCWKETLTTQNVYFLKAITKSFLVLFCSVKTFVIFCQEARRVSI